MSDAKKYKMRPAKSLPNGQPVPVFYKAGPGGRPQYLTGEGEHEMTPAILRAMKAGDVEVEGYGDAKPAKKSTKKKAAKKKAAKKAPKKTEATNTDTKTEDEQQ